jgi:hypothetical protein
MANNSYTNQYSASESVTVTETNEQTRRHPTLRLTARVDSLLRQSSDLTMIERCRQMYASLLQKTGEIINDRKIDEATRLKYTIENQMKIDKIFDELVKLLNEQREIAKKSLQGMTPEQQNQVVSYWREAGQFLKELFQWLNRMFDEIVEKIKQGHTIKQKKVQEFFDLVFANFTSIFNSSALIDSKMPVDGRGTPQQHQFNQEGLDKKFSAK